MAGINLLLHSCFLLLLLPTFLADNVIISSVASAKRLQGSIGGGGGTGSSSDNGNSSTIVISKIKIPPYVIVGQTVHLYCLFELRNGTDLYTLKWFKDGAEFYRSVPRASVRKNRRLIFPMPGVRVDFENSKIISSGVHQIALQEVELTTSGQFVCQITMDSPPFEFVEAGGQLTVISLPERFPVISGNKGHHHYALGDWVTLNCTCYDTFPAANIRWFINGKEVEDSYLVRYVPRQSVESPGLVSATLGLDFRIDASHFAPRTRLASDGSSRVQGQHKELWAMCEATMPPIEGTTFPFTREIYLGSLLQSYEPFQSAASKAVAFPLKKPQILVLFECLLITVIAVMMT